MPSEAAWLSATPDTGVDVGVEVPNVVVYVSPAYEKTMKAVYAKIGDRENVKVVPLRFHQTELDAKAFLTLMAVESGDYTPLYMHVVMVRSTFSSLVSSHPQLTTSITSQSSAN